MTERARQDEDVSVLAIATILLRNRWRIARWMLFGAVVAGVLGFLRPAQYLATASFVAKGSDSGRSSIANLAGQLGVSLASGGDPSVSPDFYAGILKSRVLLLPVTLDTFAVPELGKPQITFLDVFQITEGSPAYRQEQGLKLLKSMVTVSTVKATGVVELGVTTRWRSVSLAIASALVRGVNDYNERMRQSQASAERKFVGDQMQVAKGELRQAEDRLQGFMATNKQFGGSAQLLLERERLQRDVTLRAALFTSLSQSFDEARIREIRDTPVITVLEVPWGSTEPEPRGRIKLVILGFFLGGIISGLVIIASGLMARRGDRGSPEVGEFRTTFAEARADVLGRIPWFGKEDAR